MKTNYIPCMVMLLAGFICCIISIGQNMSLINFTARLLAVLVIFYIIGAIIKLIIDKGFSVFEDKTALNDDSEEEKLTEENFDTSEENAEKNVKEEADEK